MIFLDYSRELWIVLLESLLLQVEDTGEYMCKALNPIGETSARTDIRVQSMYDQEQRWGKILEGKNMRIQG